MKFSVKSLPWLFLTFGCAAILVLTYMKYENYTDVKSTYTDDSHTVFSTLPSHYSEELDCDGRIVYIAKTPITFGQFYSFVKETGYVTWRESNMRYPNWLHPNLKIFNPSFEDLEAEPLPSNESPVLWLVLSDAKAYCQWVALRQNSLSPYDQQDHSQAWKTSGCRLPTTEELEILYTKDPSLISNLWEWTTNTLADIDSEQGGARSYKTAWKPKMTLRHRRIEDLGDKEEELTCFRVAWTVKESPF